MKETGRRRRTLRVAAIQMIATPGESESNRARAETLVERAASEGFFDTFVVCTPRERFQSDTFDQSAAKR